MRLQRTYQYRIAEQIGVSQSAVSQELSRNSVHGIYDHEKADLLAKAKKKRTKTVLGNSKIQEFVKEKLKERKSPEQISRLALRGGIQVSRSSIYNYINANKELKKYRKHKKYRRRYKLSSKHGIPDRISIEERPEEAKQSTNLVKSQIQQNSASSMLSQANAGVSNCQLIRSTNLTKN